MAIRFNVDEPKQLDFPFGNFEETESSFPNADGSPKIQYKYTVEEDGTRDTLFATESLHRKLQTCGVSAGSTMVVVKVNENNRQTFKVTSTGDSQGQPTAPQAPGPPAATAQKPPSADGEATISTLQCTMEDHFNFCAALFAEWSRNTGIQHTADNVQSLAQTLFKTSDVKRIWTVAEAAAVVEEEDEDDDLPF